MRRRAATFTHRNSGAALRSVLGCAAACAVLAACGAGAESRSATTGTAAPASTHRRATPTQAQSSRLAQAQATHEYPSPPPPGQTAVGGAPSAVQAVRAFADAYINWTAPTVSAQMRALAERSVGQARSVVSLAAAQTAQDYELQRGGIANSGTVQAVTAMLGRQDRYVVVTRERTSATNTTAYQGLRAAWHVALATVAQLSLGHWVVSAWQPES
ncbi:MAG: hypothetical protein ACR2LV_04150 [Solirubrobacteraceae bacterium]